MYPPPYGYQCVTAWWPICRATGTCGASHQWQVGRVAPWVPVRFRMLPLVFVFISPSHFRVYNKTFLREFFLIALLFSEGFDDILK